MSLPKVYRLSDYQMLHHFMSRVELEIDLTHKPARSKAYLTITPNPKIQQLNNFLWLDGQFITLESIKLNDIKLNPSEYELREDGLLIRQIPSQQSFSIEMDCVIQECTDLFGLYQTDNIFLVKAETEGLRRVFFCIDRPDNLATYKTKIFADRFKYPVLLSNGDIIDKHIISHQTHSVTWEDKTPKPTYLFALVAGQLHYSVAYFTTYTGKSIPIEFYVSSQDERKCSFAKEVLQKAMAWDEKIFHLPCELSRHMIAGVDKYASGASEPTGLNLFNTENLFALPECKTDLGILRVLEVVAHEYFHYWTGNRVTIRDWFNLTFKEGLTTFREMLFSEDLFGSSLARLICGKILDPRAPREHSYTAVRSLYTAAAYQKGAEIFRMMMLTVGRELFCESLGLFLKQHDGLAVTLEDLLNSLSQLTKKDLTPFLSWFTDPGVPEVSIKDKYDANQQEYRIKISVKDSSLRPIPLMIGLLDRNGLSLLDNSLLLIDKHDMEFTFKNMSSHPIPSLLRDFSAPIKMNYEHTNEELLTLMRFDTNLYCRCDAAKKLIVNLVSEYCTINTITYPETFFTTYNSLITLEEIEPWIAAELLGLPSEEALLGAITQPSFESVAKARKLIKESIAQALKEDWCKLEQRITQYQSNRTQQFALFDIKDAGMRRLQEVYYSYQSILKPEDTTSSLLSLFNQKLDNNMTETCFALVALDEMGCNAEYTDALDHFYSHWQHDTQALNYWLKIQAASHSIHVLDRVECLLDHPSFSILNPNKVYALLGTFINNPYGFHHASGAGYQLITKCILMLDKINPPLAANLTQKFSGWSQYDESRQQLMKAELVVLFNTALSNDVKNSAQKGLYSTPY